MRSVLFLLFLLCSFTGYGQVSVDTSGGNVIVKEKLPTVTKALSIYHMFVPHRGKVNLMMYEPNADDYGDEPDTLYMSMAAELQHVKLMLDAAMKYKHFSFYRFAFNISSCRDFIGRLADVFAASKEWNDYLHKADDLQLSTTLYDGNEVTEASYNKTIAGNVLAKSDMMKELDDFFRPYGYKVTANGFPDDHQPIVSRAELHSLGKPEALFVPIPNSYFTLTKIK